jgi:hypothetical protein
MDVWWEWYQWYVDTIYQWKNIIRDLDDIIRNKRVGK